MKVVTYRKNMALAICIDTVSIPSDPLCPKLHVFDDECVDNANLVVVMQAEACNERISESTRKGYQQIP